MIKIIGAALILIGSTAFGLLMAGQLRKRTNAIAALIAMLDRMESELTFRLTPLPALLGRLADTAVEPLGAALATCRARLLESEHPPFLEIWRETMARSEKLPIHEEERKILEELGSVLGRYDLDGQVRSIRSARAWLCTCLDRAQADRDRLGRVFGVVSVSAGAILVLLLL